MASRSNLGWIGDATVTPKWIKWSPSWLKVSQKDPKMPLKTPRKWVPGPLLSHLVPFVATWSLQVLPQRQKDAPSAPKLIKIIYVWRIVASGVSEMILYLKCVTVDPKNKTPKAKYQRNTGLLSNQLKFWARKKRRMPMPKDHKIIS